MLTLNHKGGNINYRKSMTIVQTHDNSQQCFVSFLFDSQPFPPNVL